MSAAIASSALWNHGANRVDTDPAEALPRGVDVGLHDSRWKWGRPLGWHAGWFNAGHNGGYRQQPWVGCFHWQADMDWPPSVAPASSNP